MPGCAVHLELAGRILDSWTNRPGDRPFEPDDPVCRSAFLFGSLAPDLGYFPGGDALLADLSHCVRPIELTRNLIALAQTDADRALSWGWVTHVLGDVWIHPLINQSAAEHVRGAREPELTFADDPVTHVRVELGLDAVLPVRARWPGRPAGPGIAPGPHAVAALTQAYRLTYEFMLSGLRMRVTNRLSIGFISGLLLGGRVFSGRANGALARRVYRGAARLARHLFPGGRVEAFTNPFAPPDWLIAQAGSVVESFAERFQPHYDSRLADLPEYNLDTGQIEADPPTYALSAAALVKLERRLLSRGTP